MSFSQPAAGSDFKAKDHVGHLLLMYPREVRTGIVTKYGPSDALSLDLVVLTDPAGPRLETQVLFFQKGLAGSLKASIGGSVLARLGQGVATPGQDPPYILIPHTAEESAYATQWLQSVGNNPFQTAPTFTPPAPIAAAPVAPVAAAMAPIPQAAPIAAPMAQAPGVPQAPPQWAAPAVAQAVPQAAPVANAAEAAAALQALGMTQPPPAPAAH